MDEIKAVIQACCALNCANIKTNDLAAPKFLNTRREKKSNPPFYSYKVLQLKETPKPVTNKARGTHSSPKTHLRRGHLRRLENKTIWVKASIINANTDRGVVDKDYALHTRSNSKLATEVAKLK